MLLLSMMVGMFSTSCKDMLSPSSERHAYEVAQDTLYSYWGILRSLQNLAERYVILNECRGDLVDQTSFVSDSIGAIISFGKDVRDVEKNWKDGACEYLQIRDYYHVINSCNAYIDMCDTERTTGTDKKYMLAEYAQVQAIRAWVYMQLLYAYGPNRVPFYTTPMLTTDNINNFISRKNYPTVDAETLARELGPELEELQAVVDNDKMYDLNNYGYNNYGDVNSGNSHFVCHSTKCMFPVSVVLGDLYLLSGDYERSATYYFEYLKDFGPIALNQYHSIGNLDNKKDYPLYSYDQNNIPYLETDRVTKNGELITCIPSNKGKLEGRVNTGINRLFGFEAQMRTSADEGAGASVSLSRNYERELIPSRGYEALCDSQKYEVYIGKATEVGENKDKLLTPESIEVLEDVGDARRAWIYAYNGDQWTFWVGDNNYYGKMVSKQNPSGVFSTVYPVVYRKSTIWLRYAEALNRAGYPSYAFAILKTGLCNDTYNWYPEDPNRLYKSSGKYIPATSIGLSYFNSKGEKRTSVYDYDIKDSLFYYIDFDDENLQRLPNDYKTATQLKTYAELEAWLTTYFQDEYNASLGTAEPMTEPRSINKDYVYFSIPSDKSISNQPSSNCEAACYYIDRRELGRSANHPEYMGFDQMVGQRLYPQIVFKEQGKLTQSAYDKASYPGAGESFRYYSIGIHQRGCGTILYNDPEEMRSCYNYVDQVKKKIKLVKGIDVTADDIYSGNYDEEVKDAVEDLIIDEMGLELAFEGTRFSDLYRVAQRRGKNYLAERVAKRHTGEVDEDLRSWLSDESHWFLPIPEE